jgi:HTH-type transcriptional regulator/antitoxin HigA
MAVVLAAAFNQTPGYWLAMENAYRLSAVTEPKDAIMERARLFELAPIKDMQKRGWIPDSKNLDELPDHLKRFFDTDSLDEPIVFPLVTRRTARLDDLTPSQRAWCFRARQIAKTLIVQPFDRDRLDAARGKLRKLAAYRNEASKLPEVMSEFGIRFVVIEPLPGAKIDGAAFWLDESSPVIAVSIRYDRHDYLWFTVMHELIHIKHEDSLSIDYDLGQEERAPTLVKEEIERRADEGAAACLIPADEIESFIRRVGPLYSQNRIVQFAHSVKMHPGIIVGQLQNRGEIGWKSHRELLVKIRDIVTATALTDGWGHVVEANLT